MFAMHSSALVLVSVLAVRAMAGDNSESRTWTDDTGQFQTQASFAGYQDGKVQLQLQSGKVRVVPLERLSPADQQYVREIEEQKQKEAEQAAARAALLASEAAMAEQKQKEADLAAAAARPPELPAHAGEQKPKEEASVQPAEASAPWADASPSPAVATPPADPWKWLSEVIIPNQKMTDALRKIWAMPPDAAGAQVVPLRVAASSASAQGKLAAALLTAAADERAGKRDMALGAYRQLAADGKNTTFGISASFRVIVLEGQSVKEKVAALPAADGWFLVDSGWTWKNSRTAADAMSPTTTPAVFSGWKAVGCFLLGLVWLGLCGLLGRAYGAGCLGTICGLGLGCSFVFSGENSITTWNEGHQVAFWIGVAISVVLGLLAAAASAQNTTS